MCIRDRYRGCHKRAFPQVQILLWLEEKINVSEVDSFISAEIPYENEDTKIFEIVQKNMIQDRMEFLILMNVLAWKMENVQKIFLKKKNVSETQTGERTVILNKKKS